MTCSLSALDVDNININSWVGRVHSFLFFENVFYKSWRIRMKHYTEISLLFLWLVYFKHCVYLTTVPYSKHSDWVLCLFEFFRLKAMPAEWDNRLHCTTMRPRALPPPHLPPPGRSCDTRSACRMTWARSSSTPPLPRSAPICLLAMFHFPFQRIFHSEKGSRRRTSRCIGIIPDSTKLLFRETYLV